MARSSSISSLNRRGGSVCDARSTPDRDRQGGVSSAGRPGHRDPSRRDPCRDRSQRSRQSTLVRVLSGEWAPSRGSVELDGQSLGDMAIGQRARRLAVLPQHSMLDFPFTGREVIAMSRIAQDSPAAVDRQVVDEVIGKMGLESLSTRVYTTLSGGEKQRIQLARVLARTVGGPQSACYLLDEPTAPLDLAHQLLLAETIESVKQLGASFVLVMHDINLAARICDRMVPLSEGLDRSRRSAIRSPRAGTSSGCLRCRGRARRPRIRGAGDLRSSVGCCRPS
ncbi:MAG: ATP-binding cassette domain-containing protein [Gammaproteobacteria bacterium]|nr:ATP-binding cassette domain-containing protein [Gammaproteobacteria bacterium]